MHNSLQAVQTSTDRILLAARKCFGRKGFQGVSMSEIAREAGVSKSLLHYHFETKENLLIEVQLGLLRDLLVRVRNLTQSSTTLLQFNAAMHQVMEFIEEDIDQLRVLLELHTAAASNPAMATRLNDFNEEVASLMVEAIHNVLGAVSDRMVLPPDRLATILRTFFDGLIINLAYAQDAEARAAVRQSFFDMRDVLASALLQEVNP